MFFIVRISYFKYLFHWLKAGSNCFLRTIKILNSKRKNNNNKKIYHNQIIEFALYETKYNSFGASSIDIILTFAATRPRSVQS